MSLRQLIDEAPAEKAPDLQPHKDRIMEAVADALKSGSIGVDVRVPYELASDLAAWVESEGVRCAIVRQGRDFDATLVISPRLAPPSPVVDEVTL